MAQAKRKNYNDLLFPMLKALKLPLPVPEYMFHPTRKWRFDYAWIEKKLALEIEGGIFTAKGGHSTGVGIWKDIDKYNEATLLGWRVIRVVPIMLTYNDGRAFTLIERALGSEKHG